MTDVLGQFWRSDSLASSVAAARAEISGLNDAELQQHRQTLASAPAAQPVTEKLLASSFAVVTEVAWRVNGYRYRDAELLAGAHLYAGHAVEIDDNGANHLIAVLPAYVCALLGERVHVITTTSELARRDFNSVKDLCAQLGLQVAFQHSAGATDPGAREIRSDITFGDFNSMAFEYLRLHQQLGVPRSIVNLAIVDQIDSVLVDGAHTSIAIGAERHPDIDSYRIAALAAARLSRGTHYGLNEETGMVDLTADGLALARQLMGAVDLDGLAGALDRLRLDDALKARHWYRHGVDYTIADGKLVISRSSRSRLNGSSRLLAGIQQAIEAKEGIPVSAEDAVAARITASDYFRTYKRLSGISSVATIVRADLERIYGMPAPAELKERSGARTDLAELAFDTGESRFRSLVDEAAKLHQTRRPVIIGVTNPEDGHLIRQMLDARTIASTALLDRENDPAEETMAQAGQPGAITVLTASAARGWDVRLHARQPDLAEPNGGLAVLIAGRSRSRRADKTLSGLAGRRHEPGESRTYLSLEDPLLRGLNTRVWRLIPERVRKRTDGAPLGQTQTKIIDQLQLDAERQDSEHRLYLFTLDEVEGAERREFYALRDALDSEHSISQFVRLAIDQVTMRYGLRYNDDDKLLDALARLYPTKLTITDLRGQPDTANAASKVSRNSELIRTDAFRAYERHSDFIGISAIRLAERRTVSLVFNNYWSRYLDEIDAMRATLAAQMRSADDLMKYKTAARRNFAKLYAAIQEDILGYLFHTDPGTGDGRLG